jgi:hypothetical protein
MSHAHALGHALPGTGTTIDFSGTWVNELGSEVELVQTNDVLSGTYKSAVSSGHTTTSGDLQGYVDGGLISFVVHWRKFQAITAWVGQLEKNGATMKTLWQMTEQVDAGDEWASINAGADYFSKKP